MKLSSSSFNHGDVIPTRFTCDGEDVCPDLTWEGVPSQAMSLVLIMDDPDAPMGTWDHLVIYNIPTSQTYFLESLRKLPPDIKFGLNSWRKAVWGGPCPPDREHRYFFRLYAIDKKLHFDKLPDKKEILTAIKDHIIASAELMGRYNRPHNS